MKIDRLIGIITILLQNDKVTAPALARRFEVSKRTINRDIEDICKAGIPVVTTQGYGGGISIANGYKVDKTVFTKNELRDIFAGLSGIDSISKRSATSSLLDKLSAEKQRIVADDMIMIDLASHYQASLVPKIDLIKTAISAKRVLSFQYYYEKGEMERRIEPYHLVFKWSAWYLFGFCLDRQAYRLFKLNRLWNLHILDETFAARDVPREALALDERLSEPNVHLKALFEVSEKHRLIDEYGIDCFTIDTDGKLLFERDFANYNNMREWIFSFGDKVFVLAPKELRDERKKQAKNILKQHDI